MRRHLRVLLAVATLGLLVAAGSAGFSSGWGRVYVVRPGDSLWAISRANGITMAQLASANHMHINDILLIGRRLTIPSAHPAVRSAGSGDTDSGAVSAAGVGATTVDAWSFCSTFRPSAGPVGVIPALLAESPGRLALRPLFEEWAYHYDLSLPLLEAVAWQESGWQQGVVSPAGAVGVGQIMPGTARFISSELVGFPLDIDSASDNIRMAAAFVAYVAGIEGNNRCATIAAYYEGPRNLALYGVFPETQAYVASVEALIPRFE